MVILSGLCGQLWQRAIESFIFTLVYRLAAQKTCPRSFIESPPAFTSFRFGSRGVKSTYGNLRRTGILFYGDLIVASYDATLRPMYEEDEEYCLDIHTIYCLSITVTSDHFSRDT